MKSPMIDFPNYSVIDAVDLRPFDSKKSDYGVKDYFETLGFVPQVVTLLENSIEQIHSYNGVIDNETMPYLWCAERAMPGGNMWSKRQFYGLIEEVHRYGAKFYMGVLGCPNQFAEYHTRAQWLYDHESEFDLFLVLRDGSSSREKLGNINPLRRLPDGRWYEDVFIQDALRYMDDYNMDGFYCGDGWCGLNIPLEFADYHPDMIAQFEESTGIMVQGTTTEEKADFLWKIPENRVAWTNFYADRWASFYRKVYQAFHKAGKDFMVIDPWARGPVDALYDFGVDYRKIAPYLDALCLEAREENWGRRGGEWSYVWETGERVNLSTIRACAPRLKLYWAACTCNAPEHWIVTRDCPNVIERQSLSLPLLTYVDDKGRYVRALEGLHLIFGTDLTADDWRFLDTRWDFSYTLPIRKTLGPAIVWSDAVFMKHFSAAKRWELNAGALNLVTAGLPAHCAVCSENIPVSDCDGYLLVDPVGITDTEVAALEQKLAEGKGIIVVGETDNKRLMKLLGIQKTVCLETDARILVHREACERLAVSVPEDACFHKELDILDHIATDAEPLVSATDGRQERVLLSIRKTASGGKAVFARRRHSWPKVPCRGRYFKDYRQFINELPDAMDKLISDVAGYASNVPVCTDQGQLYLMETGRPGEIHIGLGNMGNIFSVIVTVTGKRGIRRYDDYVFKRYSCGGNILFDSTPNSFQVKVPMDGAIPLKVCLEQKED